MQKNDETRRTVLKAFGITALTAASTKSFPATAAQQRSKAALLLYNTVEDLQRDAGFQEGSLVRTLGYHSIDDGGGAEYLVKKAKPTAAEGVLELSGSLFAELVNVKSVNYKMFGTLSDGENDDGVQIKTAHAYANRLNVPVVNPSGEYWIKSTNSIIIQTNVEWGHTVFHVDEKYESNLNTFIVQSREPSVQVEFDPQTKARVLSQIRPGVKLIPEFAPYKNSFVIITDTNDKIGYRSGASYGGRVSKPKEEFFYVEEHGRILGDIAWQFSDYTGIVAYPANDSYLIIEGGAFHMSGESRTAASSRGYVNIGFSIRRSRTIIRDQWVGLEKGMADRSRSPKNGFYSFSSVYDVLLENVRLIPWEKDRPGTDNDVPEGTYGIGGNRVLNATFRNVTAEGSPVHWGVFGTNLFKNFRVEQCVLNRIDVHFHCWNMYISDCKIGSNGITLTGGGDLFVENTTCIGSSFIAFRRDFGAKWDGDIRIRNCRHAPITTGQTAILSFEADDFDYKYPIGYGRTLRVEDVVVDFRTVPGSVSTSWLMRISPFSKRKDGDRVFFPSLLEFRNVSVEGREQGMRLLRIPDPQNYKLAKQGAYDGVKFNPNCIMLFENIQLEKMAPQEPQSDQVHLAFTRASGAGYMDGYALYPEVRIVRCNDLSVHFGGNASDATFEQCRIVRLTGSESDAMPGSLTFNGCKFEAAVKDNGKAFFMPGSTLGTSFVNCLIYAPVVDDTPQPELTDRIGFIRMNKAVLYNHINTRLGKDILNFYKEKNIKIQPRFIAMMKAHHELETELV